MSPYNRSLATCQRMERYLNELYEAKTTVDFYAEDPKNLAYRLREAMYAAQFHRDFQHIGRMRKKYKFLVMDKKVRARWLDVESPEVKVVVERETVETSSATSPEVDALGHEMREALSTVDVPNATSFMEVLGATMKYLGANPEVYFPNAKLNDSELRRLFVWSKANEARIIYDEEAGLTITRKPVDEELTWQPEDT